MNNNNTENQKTATPCNDIANGIERWIPDGTKKPKQFKYESAAGVWYRNRSEANACLARSGVPESEYRPVVLDGRDAESEG